MPYQDRATEDKAIKRGDGKRRACRDYPDNLDMRQTSPSALSSLNWLAFDTSTDVLSVAVQRGAQIWHKEGPGGAQASTTLIPTALDLLAQAGLSCQDLNAIVFGRGPGSFTGLRTACAVAQGLAHGAQVPVLALDTLLSIAEVHRPAPGQSARVLAVLDARMGQLYAAAYHWQDDRWHIDHAPGLYDPIDMRLPGDWHDDPSVVLAGSPVPEHAQALTQALQRPWRCQATSPSALALLTLAPAARTAGLAMPAQQALPLYLRDKVAQTTAERVALQHAKA
jgi:tRNA threonylcarbamoyladenosine biosynthesis protein TsaB